MQGPCSRETLCNYLESRLVQCRGQQLSAALIEDRANCHEDRLFEVLRECSTRMESIDEAASIMWVCPWPDRQGPNVCTVLMWSLSSTCHVSLCAVEACARALEIRTNPKAVPSCRRLGTSASACPSRLGRSFLCTNRVAGRPGQFR